MRSNLVPFNGTKTTKATKGAEATGAPLDEAARPGPLDRAVDLLEALASAEQPLTLAELAAALGLPKSTVHRLLAQLERRGLTERRGLEHALGPLAARLGRAAMGSSELVSAATAVVDQLSRELGETLFVVTARGGELVVVHQREGSGVLRAAPRLGSTVPVESTATGRLYLALAPERVRTRSLAPREREALQRRISKVLRRGWDENVGEWIEGLSVLAAPVTSARGELAGVLALGCASARYEALGGSDLAPRLLKAARLVGARIEGKVP